LLLCIWSGLTGRLIIFLLRDGKNLFLGLVEARVDSRHWSLLLQLLELLETLVRLWALFIVLAIMLSLFLLQPRTVLEHLVDLLVVIIMARLLSLLLSGERLTWSTKLSRSGTITSKVQPVHDAWDLFFTDVSERVDARAHGAMTTSLLCTKGVVKEALGMLTGWTTCGRTLNWAWLVRSRACNASEARLGLQAVGAGMVVKLTSERVSVHTLRDLSLGEMFLLTSHEILLLLLPTLEGVLLIGGESRAEAREARSKWRLCASCDRSRARSRSKRGGTRSR
jgi:hypothetical protein